MPNIEDQIRRAIEEGHFDNLPGKGKPLKLEENPHENPDWRLTYLTLKNSGFSLPWLEVRHEIESEIEKETGNFPLGQIFRTSCQPPRAPVPLTSTP